MTLYICTIVINEVQKSHELCTFALGFYYLIPLPEIIINSVFDQRQAAFTKKNKIIGQAT